MPRRCSIFKKFLHWLRYGGQKVGWLFIAKSKDLIKDIMKVLRVGRNLAKSFIKYLLIAPFEMLWVRRLYSLHCKDPNRDYLFLTDHMGDTFIILSLLESYLKNHESNVVPIVRKDFQQLLDYFPNVKSHFETWCDEKFFGLSWKKLAKSVEINVYSSKKDKVFGFGGPVLKFKNLRLIGFKHNYIKNHILTTQNNRAKRRIDKYLNFCLGIPIDTPLANFCTPKHYEIETKDYMEKHNLTLGRTVILVPYSNSDKHRSYSTDNILMFERIARILERKGFLVCTNVDPINREPIKGTKPISPPIGILIPLSKSCGYVVTYRSGFADVVAQSGAKIFVFYPEGKVWGVSYHDYFSVKAIYQNDDVVEIVGDRDKFVEAIEESIF